jgi:hypothetical protein
MNYDRLSNLDDIENENEDPNSIDENGKQLKFPEFINNCR